MSQGFVLWFTGLSGSGKSTLTTRVAAELRRRGVHVETLDGDEVRKNLSRGLGFSREDRDANIRRIGFVAKLIARSGACAIAAAISPYRSVRDEVRRSTDRFCEVYCECPIEVLAERDPKGLYKKALAGEIKHFTGVDDPYEAPQAPEVHLYTDSEEPEQSVGKILTRLEELGYIPAWGKLLAASDEVRLIAPHGRDLVDRVLRGQDAETVRERAQGLEALELDASTAIALENIACGRYSPLTGFMGSKDYLRVIREMRLESGLPWPVPITLPIPEAAVARVRAAREVALRRDGAPVAVMEIHDVWQPEGGPTCAGGEIRCFGAAGTAPTPVDTRDHIRAHGWRRVVAFAADDPPVLADEYAARCALELNDGLLLQLRTTPADAIPLDVRRACWDALFAGYFARDRALVAPLPAIAAASVVLDAIVAKNHGATHILVAAGSNRAFDHYGEGELGIVPLPVEPATLSPRLGCFASPRTAPDTGHAAAFEQVRAALHRGEDDRRRP